MFHLYNARISIFVYFSQKKVQKKVILLITFRELLITTKKIWLNGDFFVPLQIISTMFRKKKIVPLLLLVLFVNYYISTNFFLHSHVFADEVVTHSHPYTSETHTHSANALQLITNLTNTLFVGLAAIFFLALYVILRPFVCSFYKQRTFDSLIGCNLLRAPPVRA